MDEKYRDILSTVPGSCYEQNEEFEANTESDFQSVTHLFSFFGHLARTPGDRWGHPGDKVQPLSLRGFRCPEERHR